MAFPLATVLTAAPGIISAAADIIKLIRNRKPDKQTPQPGDQRVDELVSLLEKQAVVIEELARNNRNLALAVRNNRLLTFIAMAMAVLAIALLILG